MLTRVAVAKRVRVPPVGVGVGDQHQLEHVQQVAQLAQQQLARQAQQGLAAGGLGGAVHGADQHARAACRRRRAPDPPRRTAGPEFRAPARTVRRSRTPRSRRWQRPAHAGTRRPRRSPNSARRRALPAASAAASRRPVSRVIDEKIGGRRHQRGVVRVAEHAAGRARVQQQQRLAARRLRQIDDQAAGFDGQRSCASCTGVSPIGARSGAPQSAWRAPPGAPAASASCSGCRGDRAARAAGRCDRSRPAPPGTGSCRRSPPGDDRQSGSAPARACPAGAAAG